MPVKIEAGTRGYYLIDDWSFVYTVDVAWSLDAPVPSCFSSRYNLLLAMAEQRIDDVAKSDPSFVPVLIDEEIREDDGIMFLMRRYADGKHCRFVSTNGGTP